jgi:acetylglutamate kinase
VASLQAKGVNALGLSGADGNVLPAKKRPVTEIDYGWVGDIHTEELNETPLKNLINADFTPVFCALTHDGNGHMLNTNADTVAMAVAVMASRFTKTRLCFAFEKNGVLLDVNDDNSVIPSLHIQEAEKLILSGKIHSGMRPKITAANDALNKGCHQVIIANASNLSAVIAGKENVLFTEFVKG